MSAYLDPPGRRLAYDADGSVVTWYRPSLGTVVELTSTQKQALNNESTDVFDTGVQTPAEVHHLGFYFPGPRDITDLFVSISTTVWLQSLVVQYSTDSTNPTNGTWTTVAFGQNANGLVAPNYRSDVSAWVASGVTAMRLVCTAYGVSGREATFAAVHIYGTRAAGDTTKQVAFCDLSGNRLTKDFDYQDRARGGTYKWKSGTLYNQLSELYIKNFDASLTANTVVVGQENLTGTMKDNIRISTDDSTYTQTITVSSLAPGASYGPIFVRYTPPTTDTLAPQTMRMPITVASWT